MVRRVRRPRGRAPADDALLAEIRDSSIEAIDNQSYPFGELIKKLNIEVGGRNPLYDVMLAYQSFEMTDITFGDKKAELIPLTATNAKCDLTFNILPREKDVVLAAALELFAYLWSANVFRCIGEPKVIYKIKENTALTDCVYKMVLDGDTSAITNKLNGIENGLCDGFYAQNTNLLNGFSGISREIASCCCETNRNIDSVRYDMSKGFCDVAGAIHAEGEATRALINENKIESLRDRIAEELGLPICHW